MQRLFTVHSLKCSCSVYCTGQKYGLNFFLTAVEIEPVRSKCLDNILKQSLREKVPIRLVFLPLQPLR